MPANYSKFNFNWFLSRVSHLLCLWSNCYQIEITSFKKLLISVIPRTLGLQLHKLIELLDSHAVTIFCTKTMILKYIERHQMHR